MPVLFVVAGPNGAGKSTLTRTGRFVRVPVIDPDVIDDPAVSAHPIAQGREALRRRRATVAAGKTLVIETTLAGHGTLRFMDDCREAGYQLALYFISVASPEQALDRIRNRVALGGHDIPEPDVRRRFSRSLANLPGAIMRSDEARLYDNASVDEPYREVAVLSGQTRWLADHAPDWVVAAVREVEQARG